MMSYDPPVISAHCTRYAIVPMLVHRSNGLGKLSDLLKVIPGYFAGVNSKCARFRGYPLASGPRIYGYPRSGE